MSIYEHLLAKPKEELARLLVDTAKDNAALRGENHRLRHELFWLKAAEDQNSYAAVMRKVTELMRITAAPAELLKEQK